LIGVEWHRLDLEATGAALHDYLPWLDTRRASSVLCNYCKLGDFRGTPLED